jgi:hypothetical protein
MKLIKLFEDFKNPQSIVIIGGGIAGLYCAYLLKKKRPEVKVTILEKESKCGGRVSMEEIDGVKVPAGAQFSRVDKDKTLQKLLKDLGIKRKTYEIEMNYSFPEPPLKEMIKELKKKSKDYQGKKMTFKEFGQKALGERYASFVKGMGYTDFESAGFMDTINNYGLDDNVSGYEAENVDWSVVVKKLIQEIGDENIELNVEVNKITKSGDKFLINGKYAADGIVFAVTVNVLRKFLKDSIYEDIESQSFIKAFASVENLDIDTYTIVDSNLRKIIPIKGNVFNVAYSDNADAEALKSKPDSYFQNLLNNEFTGVKISGLTKFYWKEGTHYYKPLSSKYKSREEFIKRAQNPSSLVWVIGEMVAQKQGWVEGALHSVEQISLVKPI